MTRPQRTLVALVVVTAAALAPWTSCTSLRPRLLAKRVEARHELIGGPRALGELGDWLLENDRIRVIVQDDGFSRGFGVFGGSLIDADLVRPSTGAGDSTGGTGKDNFGEMFPALFVEAVEPNDVDDPDGSGARLPAIAIEKDGSDGQEAVLVVRGYGNDFLAMTQVANEVLLDDDRDDPTILFVTRYRLLPGVPYLEIETTIHNVAFPPRTLAWDGGERLLDAALPTPLGDIALFGAGNEVFAPHDAGYDLRYRLEKLYKAELPLPAVPGLVLDYLASSGPEVSYGIVAAPTEHNYALGTGQFQGAKPHSLHVPFVASAFTGMFYAQPPVLAPNDGAPGGDDEVTVKRYFIVGSGDVASVSDVAFELLGVATGVVEGRLLERVTQLPVEGGRVIAIDASGKKVTECASDGGGRFRARLPAGEYRFVAQKGGRRLSEEARAGVAVGARSFVELRLDPPARVTVTVVEPGVGRIPAKVTLVGSYGPEHAGEDTRGFLFDLSLGEPWRFSDLVPDEDDADDASTRRYIEALDYTADGTLTLEGRPGTYEVYVQRGMEYTRHVESVVLEAGATRTLTATLERVVDTSGYVGADFHLHSIYSLDSFAKLEGRMRAYAGEHLEYAVSSDHNYITDYQPTLLRMGLERFVGSAIGLELSTIDRGHYNGFPLRFDEGVPVRSADDDGGYDNTIASRTFGSFNWAGEDPQVIFDGLRALGRQHQADPFCLGDGCALETDDVIVQVNHPRGGVGGYFDVYGLENETLAAEGKGGLFAPQTEQHPEFASEVFSWDFDAMEILNGKRNEWLHNYRVPAGVDVDPVSCCPLVPGEVLRRFGDFECPADRADCSCTPDDTAAQLASGACDGEGVAYPGVLDDWFQMMRAGLRVTGTANSDSHSDHSGEPGWPRTYVRVLDDNPRNVTEHDIVRGLKSGDVTMAIGAFVLARVGERGLGETVDASGQQRLVVDVEVRTPPWIEVDRVVAYVNGARAAEKEIPPGSDDVYVTSLEVAVAGDGFVVVEVTGEQSLFPTLAPSEIPPLLLDEAIQAVGGSIGLGRNPDALYPLLITPARPLALTNPIWIDADGDGEITPSLPLPDPRALAAARAPFGHELDDKRTAALPVRRIDDGERPLPLSSLQGLSPLARAQLARMPRWLWPTSDPRDVRRLFWHAWRDAHAD